MSRNRHLPFYGNSSQVIQCWTHTAAVREAPEGCLALSTRQACHEGPHVQNSTQDQLFLILPFQPPSNTPQWSPSLPHSSHAAHSEPPSPAAQEGPPWKQGPGDLSACIPTKLPCPSQTHPGGPWAPPGERVGRTPQPGGPQSPTRRTASFGWERRKPKRAHSPRRAVSTLSP